MPCANVSHVTLAKEGEGENEKISAGGVVFNTEDGQQFEAKVGMG